jgi:hypothetical protein
VTHLCPGFNHGQAACIEGCQRALALLHFLAPRSDKALEISRVTSDLRGGCGDGVTSQTSRLWRASRGWDVPRIARDPRKAARDTGWDAAAHHGLAKMIPQRERGYRAPASGTVCGT